MSILITIRIRLAHQLFGHTGAGLARIRTRCVQIIRVKTIDSWIEWSIFRRLRAGGRIHTVSFRFPGDLAQDPCFLSILGPKAQGCSFLKSEKLAVFPPLQAYMPAAIVAAQRNRARPRAYMLANLSHGTVDPRIGFDPSSRRSCQMTHQQAAPACIREFIIDHQPGTLSCSVRTYVHCVGVKTSCTTTHSASIGPWITRARGPGCGKRSSRPAGRTPTVNPLRFARFHR